jgi:Rad3-related DNA helicase
MRTRRWPGLERVGAAILAVLVVAIVLLQGASVLLDWAADDARLQAQILAHQTPEHARTALGQWLSARLLADLPADAAPQARRDRADTLDHLADRLREIVGVSALAGLLVAPLTATSDEAAGLARLRDETSPAPSATNNGTV